MNALCSTESRDGGPVICIIPTQPKEALRIHIRRQSVEGLDIRPSYNFWCLTHVHEVLVSKQSGLQKPILQDV